MKWNSDKILSLAAMFISLLTLIFFIYQTNLMSRQNYLSILPYVAMSTSHNVAEGFFELNLKNDGVGPAILVSANMIYDGKTYDLQAYEDQVFRFLVSIVPDLDTLQHLSSSTLNKGLAIPAHNSYNLFRVHGSEEELALTAETLDRLVEEGLDFEIVYKSIQGERWRIHVDSEEPERVH